MIFTNKLNIKPYLLSSSPRRRELFKKIFPEYITIKPKYELNYNGKYKTIPEDFVKKNAVVKYYSVEDKLTDRYLAVSSDTIVYLNGIIIGKPVDYEDAIKILSSLSNKTHYVYTGYLIILKTKSKIFQLNSIKTEVKFKYLSEKDIVTYLNNSEYSDKAGCYGIQDTTNYLIESYKGSKENVMGFPVNEIFEDIKKMIKNLTN